MGKINSGEIMEKDTEFQVYLLNVAYKELEKLKKETQKQINDKLKELVDPYKVHSKKLKGSENTYRIRIGKYRVVFKIYTDERIVVVIRIAHRKKIYR